MSFILSLSTNSIGSLTRAQTMASLAAAERIRYKDLNDLKPNGQSN
jgi:hypothetical protein